MTELNYPLHLLPLLLLLLSLHSARWLFNDSVDEGRVRGVDEGFKEVGRFISTHDHEGRVLDEGGMGGLKFRGLVKGQVREVVRLEEDGGWTHINCRL